MDIFILLIILADLVFTGVIFVEVEHINDNVLDLERYLRRRRNRRKK